MLARHLIFKNAPSNMLLKLTVRKFLTSRKIAITFNLLHWAGLCAAGAHAQAATGELVINHLLQILAPKIRRIHPKSVRRHGGSYMRTYNWLSLVCVASLNLPVTYHLLVWLARWQFVICTIIWTLGLPRCIQHSSIICDHNRLRLIHIPRLFLQKR